jgi:nicotinamide-nucleotide amidase
MALRVRARFAASVGLAVSGIAGPGGGSPEKPIGLVWFGVADGTGCETYKMIFPGSRHEIRVRAAQYALWRLWRRSAAAVLPDAATRL